MVLPSTWSLPREGGRLSDFQTLEPRTGTGRQRMDFIPLLKALLLLGLLFLPGYVATRRFGFRAGLPIFATTILTLGASGVLMIKNRQTLSEIILTLLLLALLAGAALAPRSWLVLPRRVTDIPGGEVMLIVIFSTIVPFGTLEWASRLATDMGWLEYHHPMTTWRKHGVEDWRRFHVTADIGREQDPVLFWRPKARGVFSAQRFKSPLVEVPKPSAVFRIMAYGDSNTEGSPYKSWSGNLQGLLDERATPPRRYEVMNAGVAGYSSYQGMRRFEQESQTYEPDVVLVSYGWNDVPEAVDMPDSSFEPTSATMVTVLRRLFRYRLYLVIENYAVAGRVSRGAKKEYSRVSIDEYLDNMQTFADEAKRADSKVAYLTRPHRASVKELRARDDWRSRVPLYNDALREYAQREGAYLIDVQRHFAKNHDGMFGDETHFTEKGRAAMARLLLSSMVKQRILSN